MTPHIAGRFLWPRCRRCEGSWSSWPSPVSRWWEIEQRLRASDGCRLTSRYPLTYSEPYSLARRRVPLFHSDANNRPLCSLGHNSIFDRRSRDHRSPKFVLLSHQSHQSHQTSSSTHCCREWNSCRRKKFGTWLRGSCRLKATREELTYCLASEERNTTTGQPSHLRSTNIFLFQDSLYISTALTTRRADPFVIF
jgi:hypothetical protein